MSNIPPVSRWKQIEGVRCALGEGPVWHSDHGLFYWTDIDRGHIHSFDPATGQTQKVYEGPKVGGFTIQRNGNLLLFQDKGAVTEWASGQLIPILREIEKDRHGRFNDVIADPEGRVFCGTMFEGGAKGRLYRLDTNAGLHQVFDGVGCSNGMGFSPDLRTHYFIDSPTHRVDACDYDRATGEVTNRRAFIEVPNEQGAPDGMTVDAEGCLWVAFWGGFGVRRYDPTGKEIEYVRFPSEKVTSIAFGPPELGLAMVTSAGADHESATEHSGAIYLFEPGVAGVPEFRSNIAPKPAKTVGDR